MKPGDLHGGEVRVNLQTEELGRVEIHAALHDNRVTANIAVDNFPAHAAVSSEMGHVRSLLGTHDLQLDGISITTIVSDSLGGHAGSEEGRRQSHSPPQQAASAPWREVPAPPADAADADEPRTINVVV